MTSKRKYSVILGNLGNTCDRFCSSYKKPISTNEMFDKAVNMVDVSGIELVGTWDISQANLLEMKKKFEGTGTTCVSIIPDLFSDKIYSKGSYSVTDMEVRKHAIDYTKTVCEIALELNCSTINIWPGQDGYDYLFTVDYMQQRELFAAAIAELADCFPQLNFAIEYKPKEPRTHSLMAKMSDTLLLVSELGRDNVGVTIDTGHAFNAGENVSESIAMAKKYGDRLFHMHFNDNYTSWDDDMIVGSVHTVFYIEMLYWLDHCDYSGWMSMDQYPYREDAVEAISESIQWLKKFESIVDSNRNEIKELIVASDPIMISKFLRKIF